MDFMRVWGGREIERCFGFWEGKCNAEAPRTPRKTPRRRGGDSGLTRKSVESSRFILSYLGVCLGALGASAVAFSSFTNR
jgi:hypothetical protein